MKKFLAMVLLVAMLMSIASVASAAIGTDHTFEFYAQCRDSSIYADEATSYTKNSNADNNSIYVKHWVMGGSSEYTNHFRGRKIAAGSTTRTNCGAKWCTVNLNVPIQSNSIVTGNSRYSISGRGNTNHYEYDGVSNVTLHGHMYF